MTAPELKPCPFCGGEASISKDHDQDGSGAFYAVKCHKCRAKSSEIYAVETCNIHFTQVRDAWNSRADLAAVQPAPEALHRSFPDAGDGRPMPPMGDELMIAGLSVDDARFVAVQLAQNGLTLTAQPDPRDEVIARLVEALEGYKSRSRRIPFDLAVSSDAALAAAKAVQHG